METAPKAAQHRAAGSTEAMRVTPELARRIAAIVAAEDWNPFSFLGLHQDSQNGGFVVRAFIPGAERITVVAGETGDAVAELSRLHQAGLFAGPIAGLGASLRYRLRVTSATGVQEVDDPYAFGPTLGASDLLLYAQGNYRRSYEKLGAHLITLDGTDGTSFAVWAPNARRVSVVGDFNAWDGRRHPMRAHPAAGLWEIFLPGVGEGAVYKYEIKTQLGEVLLKADPYAFRCEPPPRTASVVHRLPAPLMAPSQVPVRNDRRAPIAIYEVHLGSWRRADGSRYLTYGELADQLIPYVKDLGFTHIELLPVAEYPFDGSWGYQPTGLYAPTSRFGTPDEFRAFADRCGAAGIGLILDWVAAHFPGDPHGLAHFDGTALYEHADPREGRHPDWDTLIYNFGRNEVCNFLLSNSLFWLEHYGVDGLRVDAVASMLYRDYGRKDGEWIPNRYGGFANLEAVDFLRRANVLVYGEHPDAVTIAEESTAWPMVSSPTYAGGLGFGYKWSLGWMHDTLDYISKDPVHRRFHHDRLTFGLLYAFTENFILPLSHDEVVHGKGSLLTKMPGDTWQKFANLRAYLAFQYTQPGKKLLFMGIEFAQWREWNHDTSLDWHLLGEPLHKGVHSFVRDLNTLYRDCAPLHEMDCEPAGFAWINCDDRDNSVISYLRRAADPNDFVVVVCNFTPVVRRGYRLGVPFPGSYLERLNSDSSHYGGSNVGNEGAVFADVTPWDGLPFSLSLTLPPLAALVLAPTGG